MRHQLVVLSNLCSSILWVASAALPGQQPAAVSPAERSTLEGSSFTHFPLGRASARMQTLHRDVPGGTIITGHGYRRDAIAMRGQVDPFQCDLEVTLSMSSVLPTQAATSFASNAGPAPVVVRPRTVVAFPATQRPLLDPAAAFELVIPYQVPFVVPAGGGTLCVDVQVFGNTSPAGSNQNLSIYLDAHEHYTDGRAEQPGFRTFAGCPAPGQTAAAFATMTLWRLAAGSRFDVAIREGVPDDGSGGTLAVLGIGTDIQGAVWPWRPDCTVWTSGEVVAVLGSMSTTGSYDGSLGGSLLPPGFRLWCQAASIDPLTADVAFTDAVTMVTPPPGPLPIPTARIVNSSNVAAATGTVSYAVPVMAFF